MKYFVLNLISSLPYWYNEEKKKKYPIKIKIKLASEGLPI